MMKLWRFLHHKSTVLKPEIVNEDLMQADRFLNQDLSNMLSDAVHLLLLCCHVKCNLCIFAFSAIHDCGEDREIHLVIRSPSITKRECIFCNIVSIINHNSQHKLFSHPVVLHS